jgi:predicted metalloprotease with PDZ domain
MKTVLMYLAIALPMLLSTTACSHGIDGKRTIVLVKSPDERAGYLGVSTQDMTRRLAKSMDVKTTEGALVNEVMDDSPAEEAGLKEEDVIVEVDGKKIGDSDDLREVVRKIVPGTKVDVIVMRNDERKALTATIDKVPPSRSYSYSYSMPRLPRIPRIPPMDIHIFSTTGQLGMTISSLNKQLGKYFEAPDGKGVLVQEVESDSRAEKAGFLAGDVITKIGDEKIEDVGDITDALRDFKEGNKANVEIIRKGAKKTLTLEVPDMDRRHRRHWDLEGWLRDIDPDCIDGNHEKLNNDLQKLELRLRDLGREIESKAQKVQQEVKEKFSQVIS